MSEKRLTVRDLMQDLLQECEHIVQFTAGVTQAEFLSNIMMQYSTIHALTVLGEASKQISDTLPDAAIRFPLIPFKRMYATRNRLIHGYASVEAEMVWRIVEREIPSLHANMKTALENWPSDIV